MTAPRPGARWRIEDVRDTAAAFHARVPDLAVDGRRAVWSLQPTGPALALGSAQRDDAVDRTVADALGIDVIRRRSGGGAVLILPGEMVWVDVVIGRDDLLWDDDVGRSMHWVGHWWQRALAALGVTGEVHTGAMQRPQWSAQVCFASCGAGEVFDADGRKLVGISQRRTREWARFQTMCHLQWRPELVAALVASPRPRPAELARLAAPVGATPTAVVDALRAVLLRPGHDREMPTQPRGVVAAPAATA